MSSQRDTAIVSPNGMLRVTKTGCMRSRMPRSSPGMTSVNLTDALNECVDRQDGPLGGPPPWGRRSVDTGHPGLALTFVFPTRRHNPGNATRALQVADAVD
jgi:hypothetical protein